MVKIRSIMNCPQCDEDIVAGSATPTCPKCGFALGPRDGGYRYPEYMMEYYAKDSNPRWLFNTIMNMPIQKAQKLLEDAEQVMKVASGKKCSEQDIRTLVETAITVGRMGKALKKLLDSGCRHTPGLFLDDNNINKEKDSVELSQAPSGGEGPSGRPADVTPAFFSEAGGGRSPN